MDIEKAFKELFKPEDCIQINRTVVKELGPEAAVILAYADGVFPYGIDPGDPIVLFIKEPAKSIAINKLIEGGYIVFKCIDDETEVHDYFITTKGKQKTRWGC